MSEVSHEEVAPVTDEMHHNSWSANLEQPIHAEDRSLVLRGAETAIEHTAPGHHVNLVTHGEYGHPGAYLYDRLDEFENVSYEYVEQCGCGGYLTRAYVE
jgi:putative CGCGG family rSAM target protein